MIQSVQIIDNLTQNPATFPRVLLLEGKKGVGKTQWALNIVIKLLTSSGEEDMSEHITRGTHPDFLMLRCPEGKRHISVSLIAEVTEFVNKAPILGEQKFVIVDALDDMHYTARDALLKVLEGHQKVIFLLIAHSSRSVSRTIRSRSHSVYIPSLTLSEFLQCVREQDLTQECCTEEDLFTISGGALGPVQQWKENPGGYQKLCEFLRFVSMMIGGVGAEKQLLKWVKPQNKLPVEDVIEALSNLSSAVARNPEMQTLGCGWRGLPPLWVRWTTHLEECKIYHSSWRAVVLGLYAHIVCD